MRPAIIAALLVLATGTAHADGEPKTFSLDNGLTVSLRPMADVDTVCVLTLFEVGGVHDPEEQSGLAHLCEHLYFTCAAGDTPARTAQEAMQAYAHPSGWQAQVGQDYTVIATVAPKERLTAELTEAAARMGALEITEADVAREKQRILVEIAGMFGERRTSVPGLAALNLAREAAAPSPAGARRGGRPAQVETLTHAQAATFCKRYLKPRNATLVVAGPIDPASVEAAVRKAFSKIPTGEAPVARPRPEGPAAAVDVEVPVVGAGPGTNPVVATGFRVPAADHADFAPFVVLASRLSIASLAAGRRSFPPPVYFAFLDSPEALVCSSSVAGDATPADALSELVDGIDDTLRGDPRRVDTLRVVQLYGFLFGFEEAVVRDPYGAAFGYARRRQLGLDAKALRAAVEAVTAEDLERVRESVFSKDRRAAVTVRTKDG